MKIVSYLCIILAGMMLFSACGNTKYEESVVKKEVSQAGGFQPKETKITKADEFSENGISATITGIAYEKGTTAIKLHMKNETEEDVNVVTANLSVNGIMSQESMFINVSAKKEADGVISLSNTWLGEMEIKQIVELEFIIKVYNDMNDEIVVSPILRLKTDAPYSYKQNYDDSGFKIYHDKNVKILVRNLQKSHLSDDMELVFYAENNSDSTISVMSREVLVNGIVVEPLFVLTVGPGKKAVDTMVFYEAELKENNIQTFETVTASFKAFNENLETIFETEPIRVPVSE